ncbi:MULTISPECIES: hypothetical protein [Rhodopseudomonas]|uniref:hypothetical protein n=1 Tax=Rhodopseudomonas TaxID=1073 RepID=UPI000AC5C7D4|nr:MULTISPECIES: hypothetical protein [Rhodopseudomonas]MDF3810697.1 hypothetical protein [Rhodopseudomonas sp. BAL398]WOK18487.1 hypothetical protein RBJ75_02860 [Rhodopseudomonas sp. BAL398]
MKALRFFVLVMAVAVLSSGATILSFKSEFFANPEFKERWIPSEVPATSAPAAFTSLTVLDNSRRVLTFDEQESLFNGLSEKLDDPPSAQVRKLVRSKTKDLIVCGEVNAKNELGGYVGFAPFFAGVFSGKAMIVILSKDFAPRMSSMGCREQTDEPEDVKGATIGDADVKARTRDASPDHLSGHVTVANYNQFQEFIGRNSGNIVGLQISFEKREAPEDLHTYVHNGIFHTSLSGSGNSEISADSGYRFDNNRYVFGGYFQIIFEGMGQGSGFYSLHLIDGRKIRFAKELRLIELK